MSAVVERLERHQVALYVAAILAAGVVGALLPAAEHLDVAINPVLGLLLFATFLAVPLTRLGAALADVRFLAALLALNFVVVPTVAFGLSRFVAHDDAVLVGVLLVLLTPCIDYVIVFSGLAGAASERLLAAAPVLLVVQMALLPAYLWLFTGGDLVDVVEPEPFVHALVVLIVVPLAAAAAVQLAVVRRVPGADAVVTASGVAMVPLMCTTLVVVVASQVPGLAGAKVTALLAVVPLYVAFLVVMLPLGRLAARLARLDVPASRALVFSGATRNSLVVLPLALALPDAYAVAALVVVTQTLVEVVGMVVYVRVVPQLVR